MSANPIILKVEHLGIKFGGLVAIADLSFDIARNQITALIGPNGAGKTTAFNCITGFYKPTAGTMTMFLENGQQYSLEQLSDYSINKHAKIARTFQNIRLFKGMTVLENLLVAQHNSLVKNFYTGFLNIIFPRFYKKDLAASVEKAKYWLDKVNLTYRADDFAEQLSYGDQRRLEIIRAMCTEPELLCLDEPAAGLNPKESLELNILLNEIKDSGTSIFLIEHDMSVVMEISDHIVVLEYGNKISDGHPVDVRNDRRVIAAYLGIDEEEGFDTSFAAQNKSIKDKTKPSLHSVSSVKSYEKKTEKLVENQDQKSVTKKISEKKQDNLLLIKGVGRVFAQKLRENGIFSFKKISTWKEEEIKIIEEKLGIKGKIIEQNWVGQAKDLMNKDIKKKSATLSKRDQ